MVLFGGLVPFRELIDQFFDYLLFHVYVKAQHTDKGEKLKELPVFPGSVGKGAFRKPVLLNQILLQDFDLAFFQTEYLCVNAVQLEIVLCVENRSVKGARRL